MEPEDVTGQILKTLFESKKSLDDQIAATKKTLEEKDAELLEAKTQIELEVEKKQGSQKLLETAQALVADIPEYKQRIENLKAAEEAGKIKLGKACEELNDLQIKQILLEASQKEQMAALLSSDRKQGRMSMEHRTRFRGLY